MTTRDEVLDFWLKEIGEEGWYKGGPEIDEACRRFTALCEQARSGGLLGWLDGPAGALAYLILTDQLPRNIWRGTAQSFASDWRARDAARRGIAAAWDLATAQPERQFFYLPLEHSEELADQDLCVRMMSARLPGEADNMLHARAHREVIKRFGRFPTRNAALGRASTAAEQAYLDEGGYVALLTAMREAQGGTASA